MYKIDYENIKRRSIIFYIFGVIGVIFITMEINIMIKDFSPLMLIFLVVPLIFIYFAFYNIRKIEKRIKDINWLEKNGTLIKNLEYKMVPSSVILNNKRLYQIEVKYTIPNGNNITLYGDPRNDGKKEDLDGLVDLLIDPNDYNRYYIDFNIISDSEDTGINESFKINKEIKNKRLINNTLEVINNGPYDINYSGLKTVRIIFAIISLIFIYIEIFMIKELLVDSSLIINEIILTIIFIYTITQFVIVNHKIKDIKWLEKNGILIKGLKYELVEYSRSKNGSSTYRFKVVYTTPDGNNITLCSIPRYFSLLKDEDGLVDLVIDPNNHKRFYIDLNIEVSSNKKEYIKNKSVIDKNNNNPIDFE